MTGLIQPSFGVSSRKILKQQRKEEKAAKKAQKEHKKTPAEVEERTRKRLSRWSGIKKAAPASAVYAGTALSPVAAAAATGDPSWLAGLSISWAIPVFGDLFRAMFTDSDHVITPAGRYVDGRDDMYDSYHRLKAAAEAAETPAPKRLVDDGNIEAPEKH